MLETVALTTTLATTAITYPGYGTTDRTAHGVGLQLGLDNRTYISAGLLRPSYAPPQGHLGAGIDQAITETVRVGMEARATHEPHRDQFTPDVLARATIETGPVSLTIMHGDRTTGIRVAIPLQ